MIALAFFFIGAILLIFFCVSIELYFDVVNEIRNEICKPFRLTLVATIL